jgi:ferredoxin-NADP reductase
MAAISQASDAPLPAAFPADLLVRAMHPEWQYARIIKVESHGEDAKSFTLAPDKAKGTDAFAYFSAGQYVCVYLAIGGSRLLRPYSIRSAPAQAAAGVYVLTVKRTAGGFASEYILDNWGEGDAVTLSGPEGNFTYEPLRDSKQIVGIAGGSGITPFYSLACAIADGTEDCSLVLLYGSRNAGSILLKDELASVEAKTDKVKVVHVLSDEQASGYEHGFITAALIQKHAPSEDYSLFLCGPQAMYEFCDHQIKDLGLPARRIRHEVFGEYKMPSKKADYPGVKGERFSLTVVNRSARQIVTCAENESLLVAMERAGIAAPSRCRSGECGYCHAKLLDGEVFVPQSYDKRRLADVSFNQIHTCVTYP